MPKLLHHIDEIAVNRQHDVIFVEFFDPEAGGASNYRENSSRKMIIEWLAANNIDHWECSSAPSGFSSPRYCGEIYIDVPYDRTAPLYLKIEAFLENPDGTMRFEKTQFRGFTLASCSLHLGSNEIATESAQ